MGNALLLSAVKDRHAVVLADGILPFDNLRLHEIEAYWRAFYDSATSFALSRSQLRSICCRVAAGGCSSSQSSTSRVSEYADAAFELFADPSTQKRWQQPQSGARAQQNQPLQSSSDSVAAIDALEFLSAIAFIGAFPMNEKIDLLFDSWDMSEDGALDLDEFTISLKSTLSGLAKILRPATALNLQTTNTGLDTEVDEDEVVILAEATFREIANCGSSGKEQDGVTISCEQFREFCVKNKRAMELFELFDVADASPGKNGDMGEEEAAMNAEIANLTGKLDKHSPPSDSATVVLYDASDDVGDMFLALGDNSQLLSKRTKER
ncbi:hypothetical protein PHYBOEH_007315 [Phytophthora boehmeriae]|uniref:EF-hand domain-containing protein n=1 Tax=Phytophthora boehmeriae TaxID=109152 RepID=A0A8T1X8U0_9STRA|nr:hypothetical protein PHYBOEH_007315 [Phytophthora boehmeriae]